MSDSGSGAGGGRLEMLFSRCDTSGRGWIEVDEFKQICTDMGISKVRCEIR